MYMKHVIRAKYNKDLPWLVATLKKIGCMTQLCEHTSEPLGKILKAYLLNVLTFQTEKVFAFLF